MTATPKRSVRASGLARATATLSLAATLLLIGGRAQAQNITALTEVPQHVYLLRGDSFRNGDLITIEPSALFFYGPIAPPVALVARGIVGIGGSGVGVGLAANLLPQYWHQPTPLKDNDDFFMGPFASLEGHIERTYVPELRRVGWRPATYAGPQLSLSLYLLKASLGWMVDVTDRTNAHVQVGVGGGF
jgi:hypothetical protein